MRKILATLGIAVLATTVGSVAQTDSAHTIENLGSGLWFVELSSPPTADGTSVDTLQQEEAGFHSSAAGAGVRYSKGRRFNRLWNGLTVRASATDVPKLRAVAGVRAVYPVLAASLNQSELPPGDVELPPGNIADLVTALQQTGADVAQTELGFTGRGIKVAVMDSGIDYHHPDLGGCFGAGCRVAAGYDFVGDAFNPSSVDPVASTPQPDPDPDDCNGHGTHVSGIIGANGEVRGVAPGVTFHAYRVIGCGQTTTADILLAAMEMALVDDVDVLNMSIGSAFNWPQYPTAQGAHRLVRRGISVVASIGNEGALGLYAASAPGNGKGVLGVASFDNTHINRPAFTVSPDEGRIGYAAAAGAPDPPVAGSHPLARTGTSSSVDDACSGLEPDSLAGHVALIRRGTCAFGAKAANAQAAGAIGVVLYNNVAGPLNATVEGSGIVIPVVTISAADGLLIDARLGEGLVDLTWTSLTASEPRATGGLISSFSSYGLPPDLSFKPDLGAPGGMVRSTLPLEQGGFGILSGTSMSSPHVAGAVALLLEANPEGRLSEIQQRLQNTARPRSWFGDPSLGFLEVVHRQGAGMLRIDDAIRAGAVVSPSSLPLGEIEAGAVTTTIRVKSRRPLAGDDRRRREVSYTLGHEPALSTGTNTFTPQFLPAFANLEFSQSSVTLRGPDNDGNEEVTVTITPPPDAAARLFGGYITFTPDDGGTVLRVPYAGYNGDYQAISALTPTAAGFPWLAKLVGTALFNQPDGAAFTLQEDDVPFIIFHLDHPARELKLEVIDAATGESFRLAADEDFFPRNAGPSAAFVLTWDGTAMRRAGGRVRPVPNGTYRLEMSVLKALGDPKNPDHIERWTSPEITLMRPTP